jgi:hypothetical protein
VTPGVPIGDVVFEELEVEKASRQISFNARAPTLNATFTSAKITGVSM